MQAYVTMTDVFTNFLCVILYYKQFKPIYGKLCSCLDNICNKCWSKLVADAAIETNLKMIQRAIHNESVINQNESIHTDFSTTGKSDGNIDINVGENKNESGVSLTLTSENMVYKQSVTATASILDTENLELGI